MIFDAETSSDHDVRITDIDVPFWSIVRFMIKWTLAAIPAVIFLTIIAVGFFAWVRVLFT
jgi:hypothetical protein